MSQDLHTTRVAAGYKAALHNDNVSADAKANAARRLEELGGGAFVQQGSEGQHEHRRPRRLQSHPIPLSDTHTSPEAKRHAEEVFRAAGIEETSSETEDEHRKRVMAGYKAAPHNDHVSAEAKEHARSFLAENGELSYSAL